MSRLAKLSFWTLFLLLVVFPATVAKPGQPMNLKSDEPAYYLMSLSLAHDFDLRCEVRDIRRLAVEYPYGLVNNLILMSSDGWKTVYFGKPWLVSLVAAPAVAWLGSDGFVSTNMALLLAAVWLGALYLKQWNGDGLSLLFSAGFFLLSNAFAYVFWMHTEVFCIWAVTASLYLGLTAAPPGPRRSRLGRWLERGLWHPATRPAFSAAALALAAYNKPVLAVLGLPVAIAAWRRGRLRSAAVWASGFVATGLVLCGISLALTPTASAYLGVERQGVRVERFDQMPDLPESAPADATGGPRNSWQWIFRLPEVDRRLPANLGYFLVGRHTGLFVYAPFTLVSLILFLAWGRRSGVRWALLGSLAAVALFFLTLIPFNWHGGGGFVGNRYFVNALPGFLFLVTRIAPAWLTLVGAGLAGLFVGPILFSPYGAMVPSPTLQAHTRNAPYRFLPFEATLAGQIPGYRGYGGAGGSYFFGRSDLYRPVGDALWIVGGQPVALTVKTLEPLRHPEFQVETVTAPNRVRLSLGGDTKEPRFETLVPPGNVTRFSLSPSVPRARHDEATGTTYYEYTLTVEATEQAWHTEVIPTRSRQARREAEATTGPAGGGDEGRLVPAWEEQELEMLVGAIVTYLGEQEELDWDVYGIDWQQAPDPGELVAGSTVRFPARVRNTSPHPWRARGATRVDLAYHWLRPDGTRVEWNGLRTMLPADVAPGATVDVDLEIEAPERAGDYRLVLDAVHEQVAWFSDRNPATALERDVRVLPRAPRNDAAGTTKP
jgi:hypothetical protein